MWYSAYLYKYRLYYDNLKKMSLHTCTVYTVTKYVDYWIAGPSGKQFNDVFHVIDNTISPRCERYWTSHNDGILSMNLLI